MDGWMANRSVCYVVEGEGFLSGYLYHKTVNY